MEDNNSILMDFGLGRLPWPVVAGATVMIFLSPIIISIQSFRMAYNMFWGPAKTAQDPDAEDDKEFVRAQPKVL